jgi:hypothetical protein
VKFSNCSPASRLTIDRTYRFAILGMSLSNLIEVKEPYDLLKGLLNTMNEYEQSKDKEDIGDKPKMVCSLYRGDCYFGTDGHCSVYSDRA